MKKKIIDKKYNSTQEDRRQRDACLQDTKLAKINKINNTLKFA